MNILLINPPSPELKYTNKVTPLGLCCIAATLLESGHDVTIHDMNVGDRHPNLNVDIVGITATTPIVKSVYNLIMELRVVFHRRSKIIIGGAHATAMPEEVAKHCDYVCEGEGDYFIRDIIDFGELSPLEISTSTNLNDLPIPAYHLLDPQKYTSDIIKANPYATMETSRGCYGKCIYCNKLIHGNHLRFKSPERVVAEMLYLKSLGYKEIHIMDDNFTADKKRAKAICRAIIKSDVGMPWVPRNGLRVDRVDKELLILMRQAGCYKVFFGVESGSQKILNEIKKGIDLGQIKRAVATAKRAGVGTGAYYMMGLPTETEADLQRTIDFAIELNTDSVSVGIAIPLPGTEFFDDAKKAGRIKTFNWSDYTFRGNVYDHENLTREVINQYLCKFYKSYYFRVKYVLKRLFSRDVIRTAIMFLKSRWG